MPKQLVIILVNLFLTTSLSFAQSAEEEIIKTLLKNETDAFYQRKADAWESGWLHDANISRAVIDNTNYSFATGWEKNGPPVVDMLKKNADKPLVVNVVNNNFLFRLGTDMAWVEYDQTITAPAIDPNIKRLSHEQRLLVKQDGQWKIAHQITVDPETFSADPKNVENNLNNTGYTLLKDKKVNEAIEVFKTNVKLFPESPNVYDSLGEAYAEAGNKALSIQNYEQSIKLNPKNEGGKAALAKLKQK
ncbi:tol-pal system YbgF family protein [Spirosoma validum]|uniref:Tetratricopeptide repeat protein n=1 Tax=Spirosoma validum TaxID=2771355 RepID=A0A927AZ63_9BACT|nr:hypothetical protein [Spirosoma validum]MBD2752342.1 hypothetical protein [Spirosoma validum]